LPTDRISHWKALSAFIYEFWKGWSNRKLSYFQGWGPPWQRRVRRRARGPFRSLGAAMCSLLRAGQVTIQLCWNWSRAAPLWTSGRHLCFPAPYPHSSAWQLVRREDLPHENGGGLSFGNGHLWQAGSTIGVGYVSRW